MESMRNKNDRKGGGIMAIGRINKDMEMEKLKAEHEDILSLRVKILNIEIRMLIVYFAAGNKTEDKERNKQIKQKCENILENITDEPAIILGDFNGHIGFLGHKKLDIQGEIV